MIRVFPRKTKATPTGSGVYLTGPPMFPLKDRQVWVSCTFTDDKGRAEALASQWRDQGYEVMTGGPAYGDSGGEFVPGRFLKKGWVITSRGCNNDCKRCTVHDREGSIRELPIVEGYNVADNNLLQCSEKHIRAVFAMLKRQKQQALFTGGLDTRELKQWHVDLLLDLNPKKIYFAYDHPGELEPLKEALELLRKSGYLMSRSKISCYVLIGYEGDTLSDAKKRCQTVKDLGVTPFAMLYYKEEPQTNSDWLKLQKLWCRPDRIYLNKKDERLLSKG